MHSTGAVYCYIWSGMVCVSLCLCVCVEHTGKPCKNGRTDRYVLWVAHSAGPMNLDGVHIGVTWKIRWIDLCCGGDAVCRYHYCSNLFHTRYMLHYSFRDDGQRRFQ